MAMLTSAAMDADYSQIKATLSPSVSGLIDDLAKVLNDTAPQSIILCSSAGTEGLCAGLVQLCEAWQRQDPERHLDVIRAPEQEALSGLLRADLGLIDFSGIDSQTANKKASEQLIAALRDRYCAKLAVLVNIKGPLTRQDLLAFGLQPLAIPADDQGDIAIYQFDLYDYKRTPDWLNSQHWANPNRWEQDRW